MEAIRRINPNITHKDFRARMPHHRSLGDTGEGLADMYSLTAIGMRMTRFRARAGCIAWGTRAGSDVVQQYLENLLPPHCIAENSTKGFRDLTTAEVAAMQMGNKGKYPERSGGLAASAETREIRSSSNKKQTKAPSNTKSGPANTSTKQKRAVNDTESAHGCDEKQSNPPFKRHKSNGLTAAPSFDRDQSTQTRFYPPAAEYPRFSQYPNTYTEYPVNNNMFREPAVTTNNLYQDKIINPSEGTTNNAYVAQSNLAERDQLPSFTPIASHQTSGNQTELPIPSDNMPQYHEQYPLGDQKSMFENGETFFDSSYFDDDENSGGIQVVRRSNN